MIKRFFLAAALILSAACIIKPPVIVPPHPTDPPKSTTIALYQEGKFVPSTKASLLIDDASTRDCTILTEGNIACPLLEYFVFGWGGHLHAQVGTQTETIDFEVQPNVNLIYPPGHFDPSGIALEELSRIRGAMWTETWACELGPRPWQPNNICATDFLWNYSEQQRLLIVQNLTALGYTHAVMGPVVDSDGYHGSWTPNDWRQKFDQWLDMAQFMWDHGLAPVVFIHPDNWSLEQTQALGPLFQSERAQRLLRIIIPAGWEPTKYEWSNATWIEYMKWGRSTFPNAIIGIHTVCDVDAPVGTDSRGDDNGTLPNAVAWQRIAPYLHFWLTQSCTFEHPDSHSDPNNPQNTDFQNWINLFNPAVSGSYADRFQHGYAGWPTFSAWGPATPLRVCAGEYYAYPVFWQGASRETARAWGDANLAPCYLDGGTRSVGAVSWQR